MILAFLNTDSVIFIIWRLCFEFLHFIHIFITLGWANINKWHITITLFQILSCQFKYCVWFECYKMSRFSGFIHQLTASNMPYPNSALPKSSQLRLCNYSAASMGWNAKFVMVRLLTIMFMLLGLNKNSIIFYTESVFARIGQLLNA